MVLILVGLFALTTVIAHWYRNEQLARGRRYFQVGMRLEQQSKNAGAIEAYRNALAIARSNNKYRLALAEVLFKTGHFDEASVYLHEILQADPADAETNLLLARIAAHRHETVAAIDYYHRAIYGYWGSGSEAKPLAVRWELIDLLRNAGARTQVIAELLQVPDMAPNNLVAVKRAAALLLQYGSAEQADNLYRDVLRQTPNDAAALAGVGRAQMALGNYLTARRALRRAVRADPEYEVAQKDLALVTQVLALDPTARGLSPAEVYDRGQVLLDRTTKALEACLQSHPGEPSAKEALDAAQKQLTARRPRRGLDSAAEANIATAEHLWTIRDNLCGAAATDQPLDRVLAKITK
jgi:tetratricopeptide (TPR) repeat protein